jgi:hypothetical protein
MPAIAKRNTPMATVHNVYCAAPSPNTRRRMDQSLVGWMSSPITNSNSMTPISPIASIS